jgi:hypothetical protein
MVEEHVCKSRRRFLRIGGVTISTGVSREIGTSINTISEQKESKEKVKKIGTFYYVVILT